MNQFKRLFVSCTLATTLITFFAYGEDKELTIYNVASMSGAFANFGKQAERGARLAIEQAGDVAGMNLRMVTIDTESNSGKAVSKVRSALSENGSGIFVGTALSSTALAVGKAVNDAGGIYISGGGADELTGTKCNPSMFRWSSPTYSAVNASLRPVLDENLAIKKVYTITPQYVFGEAMLLNVKNILKEKGLKLAGNSYHSLKDKEFSGIIAQAQATNPDLLLFLNFGSQGVSSLQQAINFGLKDRMKFLMVWSSGLDTMKILGTEGSSGVYFGAQYWHEEDAAGNKSFVDLSIKKFGEAPNYPMASYYQMTKLMIDAVKATGSADPDKLKSHLSGLSYDGVTGQETISSDNNQVTKNYYLLLGKDKVSMSNENDFADVVYKGKYFLPGQQVGCVR
ncbi:ABC transporter substrate-binding protein [Candidatus Endowatersipora endosymbiont of Watersipora subatra]|uniref:ABC transporter substrate-binding protein n=1 Tax=Candidatus Endowatersipora endosymbiont of Watersipora subatra TaxID=3077946 RepID=UPI00312CAF09